MKTHSPERGETKVKQGTGGRESAKWHVKGEWYFEYLIGEIYRLLQVLDRKLDVEMCA